MYFNFKKIDYHLPDDYIEIANLQNEISEWNTDKVIAKTGVKRVYRSNKSVLDLIKDLSKKLNPDDIDQLNVLLTVSQTYGTPLPALSNIIQDILNIKKNVVAFDIGLGCSGFVYALYNALSLMKTSTYQKALLFFSDTYSHYIEKDNRSIYPLFSDCASFVIVSNEPVHKIIDFDFGSDGSGAKHLQMISSPTNEKKIIMNGSEVFMFTMSTVPDSIQLVLNKNNLKISDISYYLFHQASKIVLDNLKRKLNLSDDQLLSFFEETGNTVSSSIPILLSKYSKSFKKGDKIIISAFGVGLSWGTLLIEW